jgi:hypothetical protein
VVDIAASPARSCNDHGDDDKNSSPRMPSLALGTLHLCDVISSKGGEEKSIALATLD